MKDFAALFARIDESTKTNVKLAALADYLGRATPQDRLWTIALFTGRRPKRAVTATRLRQWAAEVAGLPEWLFEDSYHVVGDLAETISLVRPRPANRATRASATGSPRSRRWRRSTRRRANPPSSPPGTALPRKSGSCSTSC